jgi:conjugative relaxase-like TrwC/TraI family protein
MIRMFQCKSAAQAKDYFNDELVPSDYSNEHTHYYVNDQELPGRFHGKLKSRLGLKDDITRDAFRHLCDNLHPETGKPLTPRTKQNRTIGYDINFHVPKSLSVLHILSNDSHILDAFRESVHDTMKVIEKDAMTRIRKKGQNDDLITGELLWGEFIHQTARPVKNMVSDPHLHAHCFVMNMTWCKKDRQFKAGKFRDIKRDMPYYQAMFHKNLSDRLIGLGYKIRRTKNAFEVIGIPEKVISLFSKRTNELGQIAKDYNITDAEELDTLGARFRQKKQKDIPLSELKRHWRKQIEDAGLKDGDHSGDPIRYTPRSDHDDTTAADCVNHAIEHRFERVSVIQDRRILETAFRFSLGKAHIAISDIEKRFKADKRILHIRDANKIVCTTREALAEERTMVELARCDQGKCVPLYRVAPKLSLQGQQREAVQHVLTTTDRVSIISGRAGTGKTTLMKEAAAMIRAKGKQVFVVAPTAQASRGVLRDEGFENAETVAKLLASPSLQKQLKDQFLWVDEAGILGTKEMTALLRIATEQNARLILSGDTRQHASVVRGDALRILNTVAGIKPAEVSRIYRQTHEGYKQAVEAISQGNVQDGFKQLSAIGAIQTVASDRLVDLLADEYMKAKNSGKTVLAVSPTHEQGRIVTQAIRKRLKESGTVKGHERTVQRLINCNLTEVEKQDARNIDISSVIQFNQHQVGIKRGSRWNVIGAEGNTLALQNSQGELKTFCCEKKGNAFDVFRLSELPLAEGDQIVITRNGMDDDGKRLNNGQSLTVKQFDKQGRIVAFNPISKARYTLAQDYGHINHAYCTTSHSSQGKTCDVVLVAQPGNTFTASDMKQFYVSVSRGREMARIYTDDIEGLLDQVEQDGDRMSALELVDPAKQRPSYALNRRKRKNAPTTQPPIKPSSPKPTVKRHEPKLTL